MCTSGGVVPGQAAIVIGRFCEFKWRMAYIVLTSVAFDVPSFAQLFAVHAAIRKIQV
jgi:hypothetical protein